MFSAGEGSVPGQGTNIHMSWGQLSLRALGPCRQSYLTLCDPMDCSPPGSSVHGGSPGKNNGVGCHALLQGIFLTQGSNPGFLHCRQILYSEPPWKCARAGAAQLLSQRTLEPVRHEKDRAQRKENLY